MQLEDVVEHSHGGIDLGPRAVDRAQVPPAIEDAHPGQRGEPLARIRGERTLWGSAPLSGSSSVRQTSTPSRRARLTYIS
jgi:hypothetical protein